MSPLSRATTSQEKPLHAMGGFPMLLLNLLLLSAVPVALAVTAEPRPHGLIALAFLVRALGVLSLRGHFSLQPNQARVLILFGQYRGTVRDSGFHWANPFYARYRGQAPAKRSKLSLRANNFNSPTLKVNDKRGNPVEIAAVVVWRVDDTATLYA